MRLFPIKSKTEYLSDLDFKNLLNKFWKSVN